MGIKCYNTRNMTFNKYEGISSRHMYFVPGVGYNILISTTCHGLKIDDNGKQNVFTNMSVFYMQY